MPGSKSQKLPKKQNDWREHMDIQAAAIFHNVEFSCGYTDKNMTHVKEIHSYFTIHDVQWALLYDSRLYPTFGGFICVVRYLKGWIMRFK